MADPSDVAFDVVSLTRAHVSLVHAEDEARHAGRTEHANNLAYADAVILVARLELARRAKITEDALAYF